jgi:hypothetical protein
MSTRTALAQTNKKTSESKTTIKVLLYFLNGIFKYTKILSGFTFHFKDPGFCDRGFIQ